MGHLLKMVISIDLYRGFTDLPNIKNGGSFQFVL